MPGIFTGDLLWRPRPGSGPFGKLRRWHAIWLLAQGWTASGTAEALERDPHTIGWWAAAFGEGGPVALVFEQSGTRSETQQAELEAAVQELPEAAGIGLANWTLRQAQEEGSSSVCPGAIRPQPEPQQLSELPAPAGVCLQAAQEAAAQGGRGQTGVLRTCLRSLQD